MFSTATRIASTQHGVVGRRQLLAAGVPAKTIDTWVERGRLGRCSRGVYLVAGAPWTPAAEAMAASLRCGPDARIAGERGLAMLRVPGLAADAPFVVLTRPGRRVSGVPWRWRPDPWWEFDGATIGRVPSVLPARHVLEAAVHRDDADVERIVDACRWAGGGLLPAIRALAHDRPAHPGARRLLGSGLVDAGAAESPPERRVAETLVGLGAEQQVWVAERVRVDFLFRAQRLVLEYDGRAAHRGTKRSAEQLARDAAIRALGYAIEHIYAEDLADPAALRRRVVGLLTALGG